MVFLFYFVLAYLLGSVNFAIVICRIAGLGDPRESGSKNPGATNVLRMGSKYAAIAVLIADGLKGFIPVFLAALTGVSEFFLGLIYLSAVLGHIFPVFFNFQGGKGVATALGGLIALDGLVALLVLLIWLATIIVYRYVSLASICAAAFIPILFIWHRPDMAFPTLLVSLLLIYQHRANIKRIYAGEEPKFGKKS